MALVVVQNNKPAQCFTAVPVSTYKDDPPAVGDFIKLSTGQNYEVNVCADGDDPAGIVRWVAPDYSYLTVELFFYSGCVRLLYETSGPNVPALGEAMDGGNEKNKIQGNGTAGVGYCWALDVETGYADFLV